MHIAKQRSTFGKLDRQRAQQAAAKAKQDRRTSRSSEAPEEAPARTTPAEEADLLNRFARLHADFDDGRISLEDFELRRDELRARLQM